MKEIVPKSIQSFTQNINLHLGARYRRFLKAENPKLQLKLKSINLDTEKANIWSIKPIAPVYFHPNKRINEPIVYKKNFKGNNWESAFTLGYAPKDREYEEMGLEKPKRYEPYSVSIKKQVFDILKNNRVIKFHQLSELDVVRVNHSKYNYIRGEIELNKGFSTAITKNHIINDSNFTELINQVKDFLNKTKYLESKTTPSQIPETLLRDRLKNHFLTRTINPKNDVITEYSALLTYPFS